MSNQEKQSEVLKSLLKGEVAAAETYGQALQKLGEDPQADALYFIKAEHYNAVQDLSSKVRELGGNPEVDSGAWGTWAKTVMGTAKLLGDSTALKALKEGEEHGLKDYENALQDDELGKEIKDLLQFRYIPQQKRHIRTVDRLLETL